MNTDFDENRKEFWAFVGRKSKGKKKNIASLKSYTGLSLKSTRGKLEVLQRHYQLLSKMSVDGVFDADWKELEASPAKRVKVARKMKVVTEKGKLALKQPHVVLGQFYVIVMSPLDQRNSWIYRPNKLKG